MAQTKDRAANRAEIRANHPDTWIAVDPDDVIVGTVTAVDAAWSEVQAQGRDDGWYPLLTVDATEATGYDTPITLRVHGMAAVLQGELIRAEIVPGERIAIRYVGTGEAKTKGRNAPELYKVTAPDRDPAVDAAKVYASLSHKVRRPSAPEGNTTTDDADTDADASEPAPF